MLTAQMVLPSQQFPQVMNLRSVLCWHWQQRPFLQADMYLSEDAKKKCNLPQKSLKILN